jgi:hypothetical protein
LLRKTSFGDSLCFVFGSRETEQRGTGDEEISQVVIGDIVLFRGSKWTFTVFILKSMGPRIGHR